MLTETGVVTKTGRSRGQRGATLAEVAAQAGVSTVAASVVLNRSRTGTRVSAATRERILEAAKALKYRPNAVARSLRQQKTHVFAFHNAQNVVFDPRYPFYAAILAGIQAGCADQQKDLLIHANFQGRSDDDIFLALHNGQIDGLVLYVRTVTPLVERLVESHLPVVTVAEEVPGVPFVGIDEEHGSRLLARHLFNKGYRDVLYRSLDEEDTPATQQQRKQAFNEEARVLGLNVTHTSYNPRSSWPTPEEEALLLAGEGKRPQVVACWGDASADAVAAFCMERNLRVPEDIAIAGFDGLPSFRRPSLRLTTVLAPWSEVARTAVNLLAAQCDDQEVPKRTILPVELLVGDTT
jgi:DNA-binding LacI/PurR family transcriptional regulator